MLCQATVMTSTTHFKSWEEGNNTAQLYGYLGNITLTKPAGASYTYSLPYLRVVGAIRESVHEKLLARVYLVCVCVCVCVLYVHTTTAMCGYQPYSLHNGH